MLNLHVLRVKYRLKVKGGDAAAVFHVVWATSGVLFHSKGTFKSNVDKIVVFLGDIFC